MHLAKIQISLRIHAVWSESSLGTFWDSQGCKVSSCRQWRLRAASWKYAYIILTPLNPTFIYIKLGFTGVYIIFLISTQNIDCGYSLEPPQQGSSNEYPQSMFWEEIWKISKFFIWNFHFLVVKFSIYLNRHVFVMDSPDTQAHLSLRSDHISEGIFSHVVAKMIIEIGKDNIFALTHCRLNRLSHTIYWKSPISILGHNVQLWDLHIPREKWLNYLQTVETLIRRCTVCQIPFYGSPCYNGLKYHTNRYLPIIFQNRV